MQAAAELRGVVAAQAESIKRMEQTVARLQYHLRRKSRWSPSHQYRRLVRVCQQRTCCCFGGGEDLQEEEDEDSSNAGGEGDLVGGRIGMRRVFFGGCSGATFTAVPTMQSTTDLDEQ